MSDAKEGGGSAQSTGPRVKFDLGPLGGQFNLSVSEGAEWIAKERQFWGWIPRIPPDNVSNNLRVSVQRQVDSGFANISATVQALQRDVNEGNANALGATIQRSFVEYRLPYSGSPKGVFLNSLIAQDHLIALGAAGYLLDVKEYPPYSVAHYRGLMRAVFFEAGLDSAATDSAKNALAALDQEWQRRLTESAERARLLVEGLESDRATAANDLGEIKKKSKEDFDHNREALEESKRAWDEEFQKLQTTYDTQLALKAPVTYWAEKRKSHSRRANMLRNWVVGVFVLGFALLVLESVALLGANTSKLPIWHFASIAVAAALFVWGARLLVRSMLTHQHLAIDAHERIVVANTFLALMRGGHLEASDKRELLAALLRHSSDGIVKDDAMPWADLIAAFRDRVKP